MDEQPSKWELIVRFLDRNKWNILIMFAALGMGLILMFVFK